MAELTAVLLDQNARSFYSEPQVQQKAEQADQTRTGGYPPVQVHVSEPVLNQDDHVTHGKKESSNLKRLLTDNH